MSEITASSAIVGLEKIESSRITNNEKQSLFREYVTYPHSGDVCIFLLSLNNLDSNSLVKIVSILHNFQEASSSFCQSSKLPLLLQRIKGFSEVSSKLSSLLLEWFKAGCEEVVLASIAKENILAIAEYAANCVPLDDLEVSNAACVLLEHLMKHYYVDLIPALHSFSQRYTENSTIYLRFVTIFSRLSAHYEDQFRACQATGVMDDLVKLCKANDVLLQMNALELLSDTANTQTGLDYLCTHQVVQWLISMACGTGGPQAQAADSLLSSQALRILGVVFAKASSKSFDFVGKVDPAAVHHFLDTLQGYFEERDEANRINGLVILSEFATISYTTLNLVVAHNKGRLLAEWLDLLNAAKPELIGGVLHSVARIVHHEESHYVQNNTQTLTVFRSPGNAVDASADSKSHGESKADQDLATAVIALKKQIVAGITTAKNLHYVAYLLKVARLPVPSVRHAALDLLTAVAAQPTGWGLLAITQAPVGDSGDFAAYITNRETEHSREGREWKYSLIKAIGENPARHHLGDAFTAKIDHMVKQGPHYMPATTTEMQTI